MKIKAKLLLGFSVMLIIMLALTIISYDRMNYMNTQLDSFQERYAKGRSSSGMRGEVNDMARILTTSMLNADSLSVDAQKKEIEKKIIQADEHYQKIKSLMTSFEEMQIVKQIDDTYSIYLEYQDKILGLLQAGYFQNATTYSNEEGQAIQNAVLNALNSLSDYNAFVMNEESVKVNDAYESSTQLVMLIMAVGLLIGLGVILWVIPSITRGLNVVSMMISSFGNGRVRAIRRIKVTSKDEIGEVALVFEHFALI